MPAWIPAHPPTGVISQWREGVCGDCHRMHKAVRCHKNTQRGRSLRVNIEQLFVGRGLCKTLTDIQLDSPAVAFFNQVKSIGITKLIKRLWVWIKYHAAPCDARRSWNGTFAYMHETKRSSQWKGMRIIHVHPPESTGSLNCQECAYGREIIDRFFSGVL